tara:strand:+ start:17 stop:433 length:417 start_codon:yes stop_codon:yes gene_type:complete
MNPFFLLFIGIPAIEIFFLIKVGTKIGALSTIALIFLTAVIGVYFAKLQGIRTLRAGIINLYQNKTAIYELLSGASIAIAAFMLIIPGFITDAFGFFLLIPITRKIILNPILKNKTKISETTNTIDGEIIDKKKEDEL